MRTVAVLASSVLLLLSLDSRASDLEIVHKEMEALHRQHPIADKEHYFREVAADVTEYKSRAMALKDRLSAHFEATSELDRQLQASLRRKGDATRLKPRFAEIDLDYGATIRQMQALVDHLVAHTYNLNTLTGELFLHCEDPDNLYSRFALALERYASVKHVAEARTRHPQSFIDSAEWSHFLAQEGIQPGSGLRCDAVTLNVRHMIRQTDLLR